MGKIDSVSNKVAADRFCRKDRVMAVVDNLFAIGWIRKAIWRLWYPFLTRRLHNEGVFFLNYAFEEDPPMGIPLSPENEPNRACVQLYHHVAAQVPLRGKDVLEVSCGHGGGAEYIGRTFEPRRYTGLDLNPTAIQFCQEHHPRNGLSFRQGDAERLPIESNTFDAVINVEASHCYPDFPRFLAEVARALKPGGHFLYADFRFADSFAKWEQALATCPLQIQYMRNINAEVLRGMKPKFRAFAGIDRPASAEMHAWARPRFRGCPGLTHLQRARERGTDLSVVLLRKAVLAETAPPWKETEK